MITENEIKRILNGTEYDPIIQARAIAKAQEEETVKRILNFINGLPVPSAITYQPGAVDNAYAFGETCSAIIKAIEQMYGVKL